MKKKKWIIWLLIAVIVLLAASLLYNRLSNTYMQEDAKKENAENDSVKTQTNKKSDDVKNNDAKEYSNEAFLTDGLADGQSDEAKDNKFRDITVYDENKNKVKLSDYVGKPLVVNFWASWCPPCKREMPSFQKAMEKYGDEVTILMINETDGERETFDSALTFWKSNEFQMNVLFDLDLDAAGKYYLFYLPRTLFIDKNGNIVEEHVGELSETRINSAIKKILK